MIMNTTRKSLAFTFSIFIIVKAYSEEKDFQSVQHLLTDIALNKFPLCGVVLINDDYFQHFPIELIDRLSQPIFTINLQDPPSPHNHNDHNGNPIQHIDRSGHATCTTILITCKYISACRTKNSNKLFKMLNDFGILHDARRSFVFIQNETTRSLKPPEFIENKSLLWEIGQMFLGMESHITLIRKLESIDEKARSPTYQLLTFTPNWLPGGSPVLQEIWSMNRGYLSKGKNLQIRITDIRPNAIVKVALPSFHFLPMIEFNEDTQDTGIDSEVIQVIEKQTGMQMTFFEVEDAEYGTLTKGKWTGVIGAVLGGKSDFGIGQIVFTYDRKKTGLKFTTTLIILRGAVICPSPKERPRWTTIFGPFEIYAWVIMVIIVFVVLTFSDIFQRVCRHFFKKKKPYWGEAWSCTHIRKYDVWLNWLNCVGPILQRSIPLKLIPERGSFRVFFGFLVVYGFLISSFYSSVLVSNLYKPKKETPFESLRDLVTFGNGWTVSGLVDQTISNTTFVNEIKLLEGAIDIGSGSSFQASQDHREFQYSVEADRCTVTERFRGKYVINQKYTEVRKGIHTQFLRCSKESFYLGPSGWAMRGDTDFVFKSFIDHIFRVHISHGFLQKGKANFAPGFKHHKFQEEDKNAKGSLRQLGIEPLQIVWLIYLGGLGISVLVFVLECTVFSIQEVRVLRSPKKKVKKIELLRYGGKRYLP